ncbi:MAG: hypothetical protein A2289_04800 [Deltaproteobacteria bacterium RIFOXYA12_FULL_58_15]|nr:MAG: hypothetical protein A2289_04800 [Deltaproteobacteria bacterium RIFOXYA12_FULL_58_15]
MRYSTILALSAMVISCGETVLVSGSSDLIADPCDGETCSDHGTCVENAGTMVCNCTFGYTPGAGLTCVDLCDGETCSGHGMCVNNAGTLDCDCEFGYVSGTDLTCVGSCDGVTCSDHGTCVDNDGTMGCSCEFGYTPGTGLTCVVDESPPEISVLRGEDSYCPSGVAKDEDCAAESGFYWWCTHPDTCDVWGCAPVEQGGKWQLLETAPAGGCTGGCPNDFDAAAAGMDYCESMDCLEVAEDGCRQLTCLVAMDYWLLEDVLCPN